jgi:hypothetical protein
MARYGKAMIDDAVRPGTADAVEAALREELAQGEAVAGTIAPILRHLLANDDNALFSDEIVARVRGMVGDVVGQLLDRRAAPDGAGEPREHDPEAVAALTEAMVAGPAFLCHVHALALEWQLTERLQARLALDPVLPPLLQALIASPDPATAALAMQFLAAQARFGQAQRRMRLPLAELPGDLLHVALLSMRALAGADGAADAQAAAAEAAIRADYDEGRSRLGMISRLVTGMGGGAVAALSIGHAGVAIFLSALAIGAGQDRDSIALSTNEAQLARLALALCAAGLKASAIEEQFLAIHPDTTLAEGIDRLGPDRAAALLAAARAFAGS